MIIDIARWITRYLYLILTAIGTLLLSISCSYIKGFDFTLKWHSSIGIFEHFELIVINPFTWIFIGVIILIVGLIGAYQDNKELLRSNNELKSENAKYQDLKRFYRSAIEDQYSLEIKLAGLHKDNVRTWLKGIFKQLELTTNVRVTIYYEFEDAFMLLARYSKNPNISKLHRLKFQFDEGVISKTWEHMEYINLDIPDFKSNPDGYYDAKQQEFAYHKSFLDRLNMKSCDFFGMAILDADQSVGVILFESNAKGNLTKEKIAEIKRFCEPYQSYLAGFIREAVKYEKQLRNRSTKYSDVDINILREYGGKDGKS